jgi:cytochrome P450
MCDVEYRAILLFAGQFYMIQRFFDPLWRLKRKLNLGLERKIKEQMAILNRYALQFVKSRRREIEVERCSAFPLQLLSFAHYPLLCCGVVQEGKERTDLISHFMNQAKKDGTALSDNQLRDIIVNFLVAGRDTTAVALSWFCYEMSQNPAAFAKVQAEVDKVGCQISFSLLPYPQFMCDVQVMRDRSGVPDFQCAAEMRYTEAALLESLRLHPSVPGDERQV